MKENSLPAQLRALSPKVRTIVHARVGLPSDAESTTVKRLVREAFRLGPDKGMKAMASKRKKAKKGATHG